MASRADTATIVSAWAVPVLVGGSASLALVGVYFGIVGLANSPDHAADLLWSDRYLVAPIAAGFGLQVGLFVYVRALLRAEARALRATGALTAAGTGTSTLAMVACCAHHLTDVLPFIGLSGAAIFLNDYRTPLMLLGLAVNVVGIGVMLRLVWATRQRAGLRVHALAGGA